MARPRSSSRASSFASQDTTITATPQNAALLGASTAFRRPAVKSKAPTNTYTGAGGALAAAATVGIGHKTPSPKRNISGKPAPPLLPNSTGGSISSVKNNARNTQSLPMRPASHLGLPSQAQNVRSKTPSQAAASLAAARAPAPTIAKPDPKLVPTRAQTTRRPAAPPKPRRFSSFRAQDGRDEADNPNDLTPIPPTTSLVELYERKNSNAQPSNKRPEPIVIKPSKDIPIKSPKPVRTSGGITSMFQMELENKQTSPKPTMHSSMLDRNDADGFDGARATSGSYTSASDILAGSSPPITARRRDATSPAPSVTSSRTALRQSRPSPASPRNSTSEAINIQKPPPRTITSPPEVFTPSSASMKSIPAYFNELHARGRTPNINTDQLADAMVAGSIASSRAPSPRKEQPPPPPTRRKHHAHLTLTRTPSPAKSGMRHTLRKVESESSDDEDEDRLHPYGKHKKKRLVRKHPNKHHEGDRKRWRDAVTERERKRYEGVWAANKGLYCSFAREERSSRKVSNSSTTSNAREGIYDQVSNITTRELWSRSQLPNEALEVIWDLVDSESVGRLSKEEFVVGMWLIDQKLKGRKLPVKVGESVWASVKGLQGIKIRK